MRKQYALKARIPPQGTPTEASMVNHDSRILGRHPHPRRSARAMFSDGAFQCYDQKEVIAGEFPSA
jgi:hypothetical protein